MSELVSIAILIVVALFAFVVITNTMQIYEESENFCENIGMELKGWLPGGYSLTCRGLQNDEITEIRFEKIDGKYYPVKGAN